jgi:acyl carrier protein
MNIEDRVKKIVSHQFSKSLNLIQNNSSFVDDLDGDSLDTVELVMAIEEEFDLEIIDDDAEKI